MSTIPGNADSAAPESTDTAQEVQKASTDERCAAFLKERLELKVVGNTSGSTVWLHSPRTRRLAQRPLNSLTTAFLSQLSGRPVQVELSEADLTLAALKDHIAVVSSTKNLDACTPRGAGIYRDGGQLLVVSGGEAFLWDGRKKTAIDEPAYQDYLFDFNEGYSIIPDLDLAVQEAVDMNVTATKDIWTYLVMVLKRWRWAQPFAAEILAGQVIATILQVTWPWKAHTYLCARRNTGKSTLLNMLAVLLGPLAHQFGPGTSEAAIRQRAGTRGHFVLLDEFDQYDEREKILGLLRAANQGGSVVKGTSSGQPMVYVIDCLAWVASIEHAATSAADQSRFLTFDLTPVTRQQKAWGLPAISNLERLRRALYAAALRHFRAFFEVADQLRSTPETGLDGRMQDALAVPCAIWATMSRQDPGEVMRKVAEAWQPALDAQVVDDEVALLRDILQYKFRTDEHAVLVDNRFRPTTVGQAVLAGHAESDLETLGIKCTRTHAGQLIVAFWPDAVRRHCLKGTKWANLNIRDILLRLPDAAVTRVRLAGLSNARVVGVPFRVIENLEV